MANSIVDPTDPDYCATCGGECSAGCLDYRVIVGNIGTVYTGRDRAEAFRVFAIYVDQSQSEAGRAGGEDVTILQDADLVREFVGSRAQAEEA